MDDSIDLNNNSAEEKIYSLRPRSSIKSSREYEQDDETWKPRGRTKKRSKQKSAPLSKYRRKTANARERSRMREINEAFEALRRAVPHLNLNSDNPGEKISKIMTLRLAMKYITALSNALEEPNIGESTSLSDIILSCEGAITPGSISEHSNLGDEFLATTFQNESLSSSSPSYDIPGFMTPPLSEATHLPPFNHLRPDPAVTTSRYPTNVLLHTLTAIPREDGKPVHQSSPLSLNLCDLRNFTLTPPEEVDLPRGVPSYQFKENSQPTISYASSTFTDFDGLPSPSMDFEDLLIK